MDKTQNNNVTITGFNFCHEVSGEKFYAYEISITRMEAYDETN